MLWLPFLLIAGAWPVVQAKVHHIFVTNRNAPAAIHSVEFDDEANTLKLVKSVAGDGPFIWTSFSHDRKNIYASSLQDQRIASYRVVNPSTVELSGTIPTSGGCGGTTAYTAPSTIEPYYVYTAKYPGPNSCGMALKTKPDGSLDSVASTWTYANGSAVHGLSLGVRNGTDYLFSADLNGDETWLHRIDAAGKAQLLSRQPSVLEHGGPRHLMVHPNMAWVYVVLEEQNSIAAMKIQDDKFTAQGSYTHKLIPDGADDAKYWSSNVRLSANNRYLWVTARGRAGQNTTSQLSCFLLDPSGAVLKLLFRLPAGLEGQGSGSNAVAPAPWSDEYAIYSDTPGGFIEVLKLDGRNETALGVEFSTAKAVARLQIARTGCCANALWYD